MSPSSKGRPPGRGRRQPARRAGAGRAAREESWLDDPVPGDRRSWAMPAAHGTYHGLDLELLDPADEGQLEFIVEAMHPQYEAALRSGAEVVVDGEPVSPRLHVAMHMILATGRRHSVESRQGSSGTFASMPRRWSLGRAE